ncbi:50S ribosomal protein L29 [Methanobacterium sp. CWC-01]|jgi:large subunit ribosomal protein L29|uniref:50S ribosomal protein L29 n=1 Tax=Methanobacterium aridiramus TaxID=2584467 RepID=UPI002575069F|nr:50S ribosomal protein L29 [Methanobacterium sp. CWC-01]WJI10225.1 50S ribosomal protein L29 [Methanobacterium sp. CWC-01]
MVILRSKEIRDMDLEDIQKKLDELRAEYARNISKSAAAGVYENPGKIKELKRTIARVMTIMNEIEQET